MSAPAPFGGATRGVLIAFAVILLIVTRRVYRSLAGTRVSVGRTVGYTAFYFAFGSLFVVSSFLEGVPYYYGVPAVLALIAGIVAAHRLAERRLRYWKGPEGAVFYKGGVVIYLIYVAGLAVRLGLESVFIGPSAFTFTFAASLSQTAVLTTAAADILLTFGIGLLVGRNVRVYGDYRDIVQGRRTVAEGQ